MYICGVKNNEQFILNVFFVIVDNKTDCLLTGQNICTSNEHGYSAFFIFLYIYFIIYYILYFLQRTLFRKFQYEFFKPLDYNSVRRRNREESELRTCNESVPNDIFCQQTMVCNFDL